MGPMSSTTSAATPSCSTARSAQINPALQVAGVGGFNGADTADLLMRDPTTGVFTLYDVSNNNITGNVVVGQVGLEWTVSGFGDFSTRASETDMLMRNSNTGQFEVYDIANNAITFAGPMGQVGLEWSIAGFGDFSTRANETDMLMRNSNTGAFEVYDIVNNTITSFAPDGPGRAGMDDRGLWRFLDPRQRDRHADAQLEYRRIRGLRHQQQHHHIVRPHGPGRPGMDDCGLWRFLRQRQRNRHADAQFEYRRVRTLRHQQQYHHADDHPVRPGRPRMVDQRRIGHSRPTRHAADADAAPAARKRWRRSHRAPARSPHPLRSSRPWRRRQSAPPCLQPTTPSGPLTGTAFQRSSESFRYSG